MQAVILAGGLATRLRPITERVPKSLIPIYGRPFLEYQLDFLKAGGVQDVVLCIGYMGDQIKQNIGNGSNFGVSVRYSYDGEQLLGTGGALKKAEGILDEKFFVIYGDSYLFIDFISVMSYFDKFKNPGLMTIYKNDNLYDRSNVVLENNMVKLYNKDKTIPGMVYIDYGASLLRRGILDSVPREEFYSLETIFNRLIKKKQLLAYEIRQRFFQIGSPEGLKEFEQYVFVKEKLVE